MTTQIKRGSKIRTKDGRDGQLLRYSMGYAVIVADKGLEFIAPELIEVR